jgi:hypothetical protein
MVLVPFIAVSWTWDKGGCRSLWLTNCESDDVFHWALKKPYFQVSPGFPDVTCRLYNHLWKHLYFNLTNHSDTSFGHYFAFLFIETSSYTDPQNAPSHPRKNLHNITRHALMPPNQTLQKTNKSYILPLMPTHNFFLMCDYWTFQCPVIPSPSPSRSISPP